MRRSQTASTLCERRWARTRSRPSRRRRSIQRRVSFAYPRLLAHSSGEWLSSEWPVCAISETAAPRRMGAARTYATRDALSTLVGIAGEDDLDAPDLNAKIDIAAPDPTDVAPRASGATQSTPSALGGSRPGWAPAENKVGRILPSRKMLDPEQSAALREQLLADLAVLQSDEEAARWVHKNLPAKNTLTAADADGVEASFREKLAAIESASAVNEEPSADPNTPLGQASPSMARSESRSSNRLTMTPSARSPIVLPGKKPRHRRGGGKGYPAAGQGALQVRHHAALRVICWPKARSRAASYSLRAAARARPKSQRRVHGPCPVSPPSPRAAPLWR